MHAKFRGNAKGKPAMLARATLAVAFFMALTTAARADLAPEPYEPSSPYFWAAVVAVVAAAAFYVFRRRGK